MVIWLAGKPRLAFYSLTASHTASSPSSREERNKSHKMSTMIKSWSLPWFYFLQKSHKRCMDLTSSLRAPQPAPPAWLSGAWNNKSFISHWLHLTFPFNGWRRERSQRAFWAEQRNWRSVGLISGCCPSPANAETRQVPLPPTLHNSFAECKKEDWCCRGAHRVHNYLL